jgi:hypothetical protein
MKGHAMFEDNKTQPPIELVDLILEFNPDASMAMITKVISQWGDLFDDRQISVQNAGKTDCTALNVRESGQQTYCPHLPTATSSARQE